MSLESTEFFPQQLESNTLGVKAEGVGLNFRVSVRGVGFRDLVKIGV